MTLEEVGVLLDKGGRRLVAGAWENPAATVRAAMQVASVEGEYPETSSQRSCWVAGPCSRRNRAARSTPRVGSKSRRAWCRRRASASKMGRATSSSWSPRQVRAAVHPEVLRKPAVRLLPGREVDERSERGLGLSGGEEAGGGVAEVPDPDEVVAALVFVALGGTPGD